MKTKTILAIAAILVILGAGFAMARPTGDSFWNNMMGGNWFGNNMMGNGMMGGNGPGNNMMSNGMMGGNGICEGYAGNGNEGKGTPITIEKAKEAAEQYLVATGNTNLVLSEVMEFENNWHGKII